MSYEHCDIHDIDATNGCPVCERLCEEADIHYVVADWVRQVGKLLAGRKPKASPMTGRQAQALRRLEKELMLAHLRLVKGGA